MIKIPESEEKSRYKVPSGEKERKGAEYRMKERKREKEREQIPEDYVHVRITSGSSTITIITPNAFAC